MVCRRPWHGSCGPRSTHVLTCGTPEPLAAKRVATSSRCAVQQQRRRRPQLVRPGARSPHDPRRHARRDNGVLRPRGGRAPASLVAMLREASPQKPTGPWSKICTAWFNSLVHRARPYPRNPDPFIILMNVGRWARIERFVSGVQTPPGWRVVALDVAVLPLDGHDRGDGHLDG